jgi:hypothetical protein
MYRLVDDDAGIRHALSGLTRRLCLYGLVLATAVTLPAITPAHARQAAVGGVEVLLDTTNATAVRNGAARPVLFRLDNPRLVTLIQTYHWNGGRGARGGWISLQDQDGRQYGPWQVTTSGGQDGAPDVFWNCSPNTVLPAGAYKVIVSDNATWSSNPQSKGRGFVRIEGRAPAAPNQEHQTEKVATLRSQHALVEALRLRTLASASVADATARCPVGPSLDALLASEIGSDFPEAWAFFFSGSFVLVGDAMASAPVIAFYNPWLDGALITRWVDGEQGPQMADAALWIASSFPARDDGIVPRYARWIHDASTTPLPVALRTRYQQFLDAFAQAYPPQGAGSGPRLRTPDQIVVRHFIELQALGAMQNLVGIPRLHGDAGTQIVEFLGALRQADREALLSLLGTEQADVADTLLGLPAGLRERLVGIFALTSQRKALVAFGVPDLPRYFILGQFATGSDRPPVSVSVHDLETEAMR